MIILKVNLKPSDCIKAISNDKKAASYLKWGSFSKLRLGINEYYYNYPIKIRTSSLNYGWAAVDIKTGQDMAVPVGHAPFTLLLVVAYVLVPVLPPVVVPVPIL